MSNNTADEIMDILNGVLSHAEAFLAHYGTPRHSGRYPWGSGEHPYQHSGDFLARVELLQKEGKTLTQIAREEFGISSTELRTQMDLAKSERRGLLVERARSLKEDGTNMLLGMMVYTIIFQIMRLHGTLETQHNTIMPYMIVK